MTNPPDTHVTPRPNSIKSLLQGENIKKRFTEVMKDRAPQFIASLSTLVYSSQKLSECDPMSVISAALIAASLDLPIDRNLGYAAIVPYKGIAQFQMQWKGYVQLAHRTAEYQEINVTEIYDGMIVDVDPFTGRIQKGKKGSETITGYYAYFKLKNGFIKEVYMTVDEIHAHARKYSKSYADPKGKWNQDFDSMAKKTVIKRLLTRWGILSVEMQRAVKEEIIEDSAIDNDAPLTLEQRKEMKAALYPEDDSDTYVPTAESMAETKAAMDKAQAQQKQDNMPMS